MLMMYPSRHRCVKSSGMCHMLSVDNIPGCRKSNWLDWDASLVRGVSSAAFQQFIDLVLIYFTLSPSAPVLPGAYYPSGYNQGHSYMHQTSMHSLRSMQLQSHPATMVSRHFTCTADTTYLDLLSKTKHNFSNLCSFSSDWFGARLYLLSIWYQCHQHSNQH